MQSGFKILSRELTGLNLAAKKFTSLCKKKFYHGATLQKFSIAHILATDLRSLRFRARYKFSIVYILGAARLRPKPPRIPSRVNFNRPRQDMIKFKAQSAVTARTYVKYPKLRLKFQAATEFPRTERRIIPPFLDYRRAKTQALAPDLRLGADRTAFRSAVLASLASR